MKKIFALALGILTAIGGFVDMGDLVANAAVGARFDMNLAWVVLVGVVDSRANVQRFITDASSVSGVVSVTSYIQTV